MSDKIWPHKASRFERLEWQLASWLARGVEVGTPPEKHGWHTRVEELTSANGLQISRQRGTRQVTQVKIIKDRQDQPVHIEAKQGVDLDFAPAAYFGRISFEKGPESDLEVIRTMGSRAMFEALLAAQSPPSPEQVATSQEISNLDY